MYGTLECMHDADKLCLQVRCHSSHLRDAGTMAHNPNLYDLAHH